MRPCDCKDQQDLNKLDHNVLVFNERSIEAQSNCVIIKNGSCSMRLSKNDFKRFAEWYLQDQNKSEVNRDET